MFNPDFKEQTIRNEELCLKTIYRLGRCFGVTGGVSVVVCSDPPDDATRDTDHVEFENVCFGGVQPK